MQASRPRSRLRSNGIWSRCRAAEIAGASWRTHGAIITVADWDEGRRWSIASPPSISSWRSTRPRRFADRINHAGAIFLGRYTPEAVGDYVAGPNHVLPTARSARFASGLGVLDFMKRGSLVRCAPASLAALAPAAIRLAKAEGLDAHALSLSIRLGSIRLGRQDDG